MKKQKQRQRRTGQEVVEVVSAVQSLIAQGIPLKDACDQHGLTPVNFHTYKRRLKAKGTPTVVVHDLNENTTKPKRNYTRRNTPAPVTTGLMVALVGKPEDVMRAVRNLQ